MQGRRTMHEKLCLGRLSEKTSLERPRLKWEDIIKADFKERELENTD